MLKKKTIVIFPSMATSGLPRPRLYLLWSRVVFLEASPFLPLPYPIFRILYEPRRSIIFLLLSHSFSSGYYETCFQWKVKDDEGGRRARQEKAVENVGRVPARHCHFHRIAAFPRLFLLLSRLFLAAPPSPLPREKPSLPPSGNENMLPFIRRKAYMRRSFVWMFRLFDMSGDTVARDTIADMTELSDFRWKLTCKMIFICTVSQCT